MTCKSTDNKNDMWAWLAKVLIIKDYVESLKWNEEKELSYEIKDSVEFLKWNE